MMQGIEGLTDGDIRAFIAGRGEPGPIQKAFDTAMSLWGYDYHNPIALLRQNDGLVRRLAQTALHDAAANLSDLADTYRAERVPPASRANPFPSPEMTVAMNRALSASQRLRNTSAFLAGTEAPMTDGFSERLRDERNTLENLVSTDIRLVLLAQEIRDTVAKYVVSDLDIALEALDCQMMKFDVMVRTRRDILAL